MNGRFLGLGLLDVWQNRGMTSKFYMRFGKDDKWKKRSSRKYIPSTERAGFDESKVIKVKANKAHNWQDRGDMAKVFDAKSGNRSRDK